MTTTPETARRTFARYAVNVDHLSDDEVERLRDRLLKISVHAGCSLNRLMISVASLQRRPAIKDVTVELARVVSQ